MDTAARLRMIDDVLTLWVAGMIDCEETMECIFAILEDISSNY